MIVISLVDNYSIMASSSSLVTDSRPPPPQQSTLSSSEAKPSWSELKTHVRTMRRDLSTLSARVPTLFSFRTLPSNPTHSRLYFLAATSMGRETSLFYVDVKSDENSISSSAAATAAVTAAATAASVTSSSPAGPNGGPTAGSGVSGVGGGGPGAGNTVSVPTLVWTPLIETSFQLGRVSREEELQLERKRCAAFGITSYELDNPSGSFVFPAAGSLFSCVDNEPSTW